MSFVPHRHRAFLVLAALLGGPGLPAAVAAPEAITSVTTSTHTGSSTVRSVDGTDPATTTWTGTRTEIDSLTVDGQSYVAAVEGQVVVRRNTAPGTFPDDNADQVMTWTYRLSDDEGSPPDVSVYGEYYNTFNPHLTQNNLQLGIENTFVNAANDPFTLNVERIDFLFDSPVSVNADHLFAIMERGGGGSGGNNGFGIAAITGVSGTDPTAFSAPLFTADSVFGSSPALLPAEQYDIYKYDTDGGPELDFRQEQGAQHLVGVALPAVDLVSAGTQIYGYSLFAQDVNATLGSQLVDYDNDAVFPTNTNGADGDLDLASIGARLYTPAIPEPTTLWLAIMGPGLLMIRRRA